MIAELDPRVDPTERPSEARGAKADEHAPCCRVRFVRIVDAHAEPGADNIGFSTYTGTVTAASDWDGPAERKVVRPGLADSYEAAFHDTGLRKFLIDLRGLAGAMAGLSHPRLQRAIGVIYRPETERLSHYSPIGAVS